MSSRMPEETGPADDESLGSLSQEAIKLIRALSAQSTPDAESTPDQGHVCTNTWCPACQVVNYVRDNPEAIENVTQSAVAFARSVRDLFDNVSKDET